MPNDPALVQQLAALLIPILSYVTVVVLRYVLPHIPSLLVPMLATVLGPAFDLLLNYVAGIESHGVITSLALSLGAVGIHEIRSKTVDAFKAAAATAGRL